MLVESIMHRNVATVERDHTVKRVARLMKERGHGVAIVVDEEKRPIGILTDRDLVTKVIAVGADADEVCVDTIMSTPVHAVDGDALVFDVLRAMAKHKVHRMPVIDGNAHVVGLVHVGDALMLLTTELANISEVVGRRREA